MNQKRCFGCMNIMGAGPVCEHCGFDERGRNASNHLPLGFVLADRYTVGRSLGQGGYGITYLCWDRHQQIPVVIKEYYPAMYVMRKNNGTVVPSSFHDKRGERFARNRERFLKAAQACSFAPSITGMARIYGYFVANNTVYAVMEYVRGTTLRNYVQKQGGQLSVDQTVELLKPIMDTLAAMHDAGLIHGRVSPDSIILLPNGERKLVDMLTVRYSEDPINTSALLPEPLLKAGFSALELYKAGMVPDQRTDVYALCAVLWFCMTGLELISAVERQVSDYVIRPDMIEGLSVPKQEILLQGLAVLPEHRLDSVAELARVLLTPDPVAQAEEAVEETVQKPLWKKLLPAGIAAAVLLGALGFLLLKPKEEEVVQFETLGGNDPVIQEEAPAVWAGNFLKADIPENSANASDAPVFGSSYTRGSIAEVTFVSFLDHAGDNAWDVSRDGSGRVMAWVLKEGNGNHLYIGAKGGVDGSQSCEGLFCGYSNLKKINFNDSFHTNAAASMAGMFDGCANLAQLDLSQLNSSNVSTMEHMFRNCSALTVLKLDGLNTASVSSFREMFQGCISLEELDLATFDTSGATQMAGMFRDCSGLVMLNVGGFDTSGVLDMQYMFSGCTRLQELDVTGFDTRRVTDFSGMFQGCALIQQLNVSGFSTGKAVSVEKMFQGCSSLKELDLADFDTKAVTVMDRMFSGCSSLLSLDLTGFETPGVTRMEGMFEGCTVLKNLDISTFNTAKVVSLKDLFRNCTSLAALDLRHFNTAKVKDMSGMFAGCGAVTKLEISSFNTEKVTNLSEMFRECKSLQTLDLTGFNTYNVTDMSYMLFGCESLKSVKVENWNTSHLKNYENFMNPGGKVNGRNWEKLFTNVVIN